MIILMDEIMLYFLMGLSAGIPTLVLLVIAVLLPKQAKRLLKARVLKRNTEIVAKDNATLDIITPKMDSTGILDAKKEGRFLPPHGGNPILTKRFFWDGTGIPVMVADARKALWVSPETLTAIELAEINDNDPKAKERLALERYAKEHGFELGPAPSEEKNNPKGNPASTEKKFYLDPRKLKEYFADAVDVDAEDVLYDKAEREGMKKAGKEYMKMGMIVGIFLLIAMVLLGVMLLGGGKF